jgi:hypothetical protein
MTAATGRSAPAANGPTDRARGAVSTVDPASSPTSAGVGEGRGPLRPDTGDSRSLPCTQCPAVTPDAMFTACCGMPMCHNCREKHDWCAEPLDEAVSRTLDVAEQTVEKARERR